MQQPDENRIRDLAYQIWQREGCPEGRDHIHWQMAVEQLAAEARQGNGGANGGGAAGERGGSGPMPDVAPPSVASEARKARTRSSQKRTPR